MSLKTLLNRNYLVILSIFVFSVFINRYYANLGVFPLDTFYHFDLGFRILQGEIPFTDIWMVSGVLINYVQALFCVHFYYVQAFFCVHFYYAPALFSVRIPTVFQHCLRTFLLCSSTF